MTFGETSAISCLYSITGLIDSTPPYRTRRASPAFLPQFLAPALSVHDAHHVLRIAEPRRRPGRKDFIDTPQVFCGELDVKCGDVLLKIRTALGPWDWNDVLILHEHPG